MSIIMKDLYIKPFIVVVLVFSFGLKTTQVLGSSGCQIQDGKCTYMVNLNTQQPCESTLASQKYDYGPQEIRLPADEKMSQMQHDFDTVKSDHENRIKELEHSIQKVLRNAIPTGPVTYTQHYEKVVISDENEEKHARVAHGSVPKPEDTSSNLLLLRLQNQFNTLTKSLSERTADLLEARNKLNETVDLMNAAQRQALESSNKLVTLESNSALLERENRILKNKLKDKTERYEYAKEKLNVTETKLISVENQLYDIIRAEATLREEHETLKIKYEQVVKELEELRQNHTTLENKYRKARKTLKIREEELMECYRGKLKGFKKSL
ncbi:hypothetical protein ACF0H5_009975 [Mactra antiquata]